MGLNNDNDNNSNNNNQNAAIAPPPALYSREELIKCADYIGNSPIGLLEALQNNYIKATEIMFLMSRTQVRSIVAKSMEDKQNIIVLFLQIFINSHDPKKPLTAAFKIPSQPLPERGTPEWKAIIKAMHDEGLLVYDKGIVFASTFKYFNLELFKGNGTDPVNDTSLSYDPAQAQKAYNEYLQRQKIQENFGLVIAEFMKKSNLEIDSVKVEQSLGISSKFLFKKLFDLKSWALLAEVILAIKFPTPLIIPPYPELDDDLEKIENNTDPDCILFKNRLHRLKNFFDFTDFDDLYSDKFPHWSLRHQFSLQFPLLNLRQNCNLYRRFDITRALSDPNLRILQKISQMIDWEMFDEVRGLLEDLPAPLAVKMIPEISNASWATILEFQSESSGMVKMLFEKIMALDLKDYQAIFQHAEQDCFMHILLKMNMLDNAQKLYIKFHEIYQRNEKYRKVLDDLTDLSSEAVALFVKKNPEKPIKAPSLILELLFKWICANRKWFFNLISSDFNLSYQYFKSMSREQRIELMKNSLNLFPALAPPLHKPNNAHAQEMLSGCMEIIEAGAGPQFEWSFQPYKIRELFYGLLKNQTKEYIYCILKNSSPTTHSKIFKAFIGRDVENLPDSTWVKFMDWIDSRLDNKFYALELLFSGLSFRDVSGFISELHPTEVGEIYCSVFSLRPATYPLIIKSFVWLMWLLKENKLSVFEKIIGIVNLGVFLGSGEAPFAAALYLMAPEYFQENHQTFHSSLVNEHFKKNPNLGKNIFLEVQKELQQYYLNNASAPVGYEESLTQNPPQAPIIPPNTDLDEEEQEAAQQRRRGKQPQGFMTQTEQKLLDRIENLELQLTAQGAKHEQQMSQLIDVLKQYVPRQVDPRAQDEDQATILALRKEVDQLKSEKVHSNKHHQKMQTNLLMFSQRTAQKEMPQGSGRRASLGDLSSSPW